MVRGSDRRAATSMASWSLCGSSAHETGGCFDFGRGMTVEAD